MQQLLKNCYTSYLIYFFFDNLFHRQGNAGDQTSFYFSQAFFITLYVSHCNVVQMGLSLRNPVCHRNSQEKGSEFCLQERLSGQGEVITQKIPWDNLRSVCCFVFGNGQVKKIWWYCHRLLRQRRRSGGLGIRCKIK